MKNNDCEAITVGQEHHCDRCGYVWDIDDNDPPECNPNRSNSNE